MPGTSTKSASTTLEIPSEYGYGDRISYDESDDTTQSGENYVEPSDGSDALWARPRDARELAVQANEVATMLLNDEISLEIARTYYGGVRAIAQLLNTEIHKARLSRGEPNLSL